VEYSRSSRLSTHKQIYPGGWSYDLWFACPAKNPVGPTSAARDKPGNTLGEMSRAEKSAGGGQVGNENQVV